MDNVERHIKNHDVISFDVYDTLVKRRKKPKDLFYEVGIKYFNNNFDANKFMNERMLSEKKLKQHVRTEICLFDIYNSIVGFKHDDKVELMKLEKKTEIETAYSNDYIVKLYKKCVAIGKVVIIVSDMYLGAGTIECVLDKTGIRGYSQLYVSSELGCTKATGELWRYYQQQINRNKRKVMHIGNSLKGDFIFPIFNGVDAYLYVSERNKLIYGKAIEGKKLL